VASGRPFKTGANFGIREESRLELQSSSAGLTKSCFEEPVMTDVLIANTNAFVANIIYLILLNPLIIVPII
jgi:hypothetical protein